MRLTLHKLLLLTAAAALTLAASDNSIGTWKRNTDKSKYIPMPANPYKSQTMVREAVNGGVKVTSKGQRADGTAVETNYTLKYDGTPAAVTGTGAQFDTASMKQIDANTFTSEMRKTGGKYHTKGKTVVAKDGKTMTNTSKGTDSEGKPVSFTIVYDRQ